MDNDDRAAVDTHPDDELDEEEEQEDMDEGEGEELSSDDEAYNLEHFGIAQALPVPDGPPDLDAGKPQAREPRLYTRECNSPVVVCRLTDRP
jgi:hypothetical protein